MKDVSEIQKDKLMKVHTSNWIFFMDSLPPESIDFSMTSPPYWGLRCYTINEKFETKEEADAWSRNYSHELNEKYGHTGAIYEPMESTSVRVKGKTEWYGRIIPVTIWDAKPGCVHEWGDEVKTESMGMDVSGVREWAEEEEEARSFETTSRFCKVCGAWMGQLGLEPTVDLYIKHLCDGFDSLKRILKKTGSFFLNLGDTYMEKNLQLIPHRVAIEMQKRGWVVRNALIWHKPNAMPSSVRDRLANSYEMIFHFVKAKRYYYCLDNIREPHKTVSVERYQRAVDLGANTVQGKRIEGGENTEMRPKEAVEKPKPSVQAKLFDGEEDTDRAIAPIPSSAPHRQEDGDYWANERWKHQSASKECHPAGKNPGDSIETKWDRADPRPEDRQNTRYGKHLSQIYREKGIPGNPKGKNPGDTMEPRAGDVAYNQGAGGEGFKRDYLNDPRYAKHYHKEGKNPGDVVGVDSGTSTDEYYGLTIPTKFINRIRQCGTMTEDEKNALVEELVKGFSEGKEILELHLRGETKGVHGQQELSGRAKELEKKGWVVIWFHPGGRNPGDTIEEPRKRPERPEAGGTRWERGKNVFEERFHPDSKNPGGTVESGHKATALGQMDTGHTQVRHGLSGSTLDDPSRWNPRGKNPGDTVEGSKYDQGVGHTNRQGLHRDESKLICKRVHQEFLNANKEKIVSYLKEAKDKAGLSPGKIDEMMGYTTDTASHWFTHPDMEHGFSFPSPEDWMRLKEILKFDDTYDEAMTQVEWVPATVLPHPKGRAPQDATNYYQEHPEESDYWSICTQPNPLAHFAIFPPMICYRPLRAACPPDGVAFDPFMGSGTLAVACEELKMEDASKWKFKWLGCEINPKYAEIANNRLKPYVQQSRLES